MSTKRTKSKMPFSSLRFGQDYNFRPKVCFSPLSWGNFHPFLSIKLGVFPPFLLT
ncbi:hypothetical protein Hanom_Chr01g00049841 [Helianthus anomalus]